MRFSPCLLGLCQSDLSWMLFSLISTARLLSLTIAGKANTAKESVPRLQMVKQFKAVANPLLRRLVCLASWFPKKQTLR